MTQLVEPLYYYNNAMLQDALQNWSLRLYLLYDDTKERGQLSRYTDGRGLIPSRGKRFLLLSTEFKPAPESIGSWSVNLTTHLHLVPKSRMVELYLSTVIRLQCVMLNYLSKGTTLPYIFYKIKY
jgi:hypothetical protein